MGSTVESEKDFEVTWFDNNGFRGVRKLNDIEQIVFIVESLVDSLIPVFIHLNTRCANKQGLLQTMLEDSAEDRGVLEYGHSFCT